MLPATLNQRSGFPIYTEHTLLWFRVNGDVELLPCLLFLPGYNTFTTLGVHIVTWPYLPNHIIYFRAIVLPLHIDSPRFWQTFCCLGLFNIFLIDKNIGCGSQVKDFTICIFFCWQWTSKDYYSYPSFNGATNTISPFSYSVFPWSITQQQDKVTLMEGKAATTAWKGWNVNTTPAAPAILEDVMSQVGTSSHWIDCCVKFVRIVGKSYPWQEQ